MRYLHEYVSNNVQLCCVVTWDVEAKMWRATAFPAEGGSTITAVSNSRHAAALIVFSRWLCVDVTAGLDLTGGAG